MFLLLRRQCLLNCRKHIAKTGCQFDDLALPLNIEFNLEISRRGVVDGFLEFEQRLDHLAGQNKTHPDACQQGDG